MIAPPSRSEPSALEPTDAKASSYRAEEATSSPQGLERRFFKRPIAGKLKEFSIRLKSNAQWVKKFLHGDK